MKWDIFHQKEQNNLGLRLNNPVLLQHERDEIQSQIDRIERRKFFIFQVIGTLLTLIAVISTVVFSIYENQRENKDYASRLRPYLVISKVDAVPQGSSTLQNFHVKNVGALPAKYSESMSCESINLQKLSTKTLIGNGEEIPLTFSAPVSTSTVVCRLEINYSNPISTLSNKRYKTIYNFQITNGLSSSVDVFME